MPSNDNFSVIVMVTTVQDSVRLNNALHEGHIRLKMHTAILQHYLQKYLLGILNYLSALETASQLQLNTD